MTPLEVRTVCTYYIIIMHNEVFCTSGTGNVRVSSLSNPLMLMPYSDSLTAHGARVNEGVRARRGRHAVLSTSVFGASFGYLFAALTSTIMIMIMMKSHATRHNTAQHSTHTQLYTTDCFIYTKRPRKLSISWYFNFIAHTTGHLPGTSRMSAEINYEFELWYKFA